MYMMESMIEMGLQKGEKWTSDDHRTVAVNACIGNPNINRMQILQDNIKIINQVPQDQIRQVTAEQLEELGCVIF